MDNGTTTNSRSRRGRLDREVSELIPQGLTHVQCVAHRYLGNGLDLDELISAGNLGVVEASLRFDPSRRLKFVTYADWWIRKKIVESIETLSGPVRLPRYRHERLRHLRQATAQWAASRGEQPTLEQLTGATGIPGDRIVRLLATEPRGLSLDHPTHPGAGRPLHESLCDPSSVCPQRSVVYRDLGQRLQRRLGLLVDPERTVIRLRFGFDGEKPRSLRQVAVVVGLSRESVRQIELRALLKIRRHL